MCELPMHPKWQLSSVAQAELVATLLIFAQNASVNLHSSHEPSYKLIGA